MIRRSQSQYDDVYNDDYYDRGTTFDRFGRAMNSHNLRGRQPNEYASGVNARRRAPYGNSRYGQPGYTYRNQQAYDPRYDNYQESGTRAVRDPDIPEKVEQLVYDSAVLDGAYHNLDNPKGDIRTFEKENFTVSEEEKSNAEDSTIKESTGQKEV